MANEELTASPPEGQPSAPAAPEAINKESFIHIEEKSNDPKAYNDLFQQDANGNIRIGPKAKKPILEIITIGLTYILIFVVIIVVGFSIDVFMRSQKSNAIAEKYRFLCPYISMWVVTWQSWECRTLSMIYDEFEANRIKLEASTMGYVSQYIPIKISKNLISTSPEKTFIISKYDTKVRFDKIIDKFEKVRASQQYTKQSNISCTGLSMNESWNMSTQCIVYGGDIGSDGTNGKLGSSRIETLKFIDTLWETDKSEFIVMDPPLTLSVEEIPQGSNGDIFTTRTIVPLQLQYVPITSNAL